MFVYPLLLQSLVGSCCCKDPQIILISNKDISICKKQQFILLIEGPHGLSEHPPWKCHQTTKHQGSEDVDAKGVSSWVQPIKIEILYETQLVRSLERHECQNFLITSNQLSAVIFLQTGCPSAPLSSTLMLFPLSTTSLWDSPGTFCKNSGLVNSPWVYTTLLSPFMTSERQDSSKNWACASRRIGEVSKRSYNQLWVITSSLWWGTNFSKW